MSRDYVLEPYESAAKTRVDYARELNAQQLAAVTAPPGPALVIAGAGSGKTRTLTYRVSYLLEKGIPPSKILLLTFTNKAAREMMRRVGDILGEELPALWGGTFHSIGNRVLRQHAHLLGYTRSFSIMDREDSRHLVNACIGEMDIDVTAKRFPKADMLVNLFSMCVNTGRSIEEIVAGEYDHFPGALTHIVALREAYNARKKAIGAFDYDDLLALWLELLQTQTEVREMYQRRFECVLVDEYQDTNKLQSDIVDLLAARHRNLMVVGDDAQSIYAWRGANFKNILKFPERYPDAKIYKIETNYRSTPEILHVANAAIKANIQQFAKDLAAARKTGMRPVIVACQDARQQAVFVAERVLQLRDEGRNMSDMAVLYRSHFHALELQMELSRRGIMFTITSGIRYLEQAHIKDVLAYLKLIANPNDELAFKRIVLMLPGVGTKSAVKLWSAYAAKLAALASGQEQRGDAPLVATALQRCSGIVPRKSQALWAGVSATVAGMEQPGVRQNAAGLIELVMQSDYADYLESTYANHRTRKNELEQLAAFAQQSKLLDEFLSEVALLTNLEAEESGPATNDDEKLKLTTVHQAKGLEFGVVFVIMLCDGLFPSARSMESAEGEEEERRLIYVAITRAKDELYLSYPLARVTHQGFMLQQPSRFLKELPSDSVEPWNRCLKQVVDADPF